MVIHPAEIYAYMEGRIHNEDATFMIGSVTKLTFYVAFLVATHKDGAEKRERERELHF